MDNFTISERVVQNDLTLETKTCEPSCWSFDWLCERLALANALAFEASSFDVVFDFDFEQYSVHSKQSCISLTDLDCERLQLQFVNSL